jgi:hypothetical protein
VCFLISTHTHYGFAPHGRRINEQISVVAQSFSHKHHIIIIMPAFKRPASLNFPTIYYTFEAKDRESNKVVEYRVQDLPQTDYKEALSMLEHFFLPDEEICVSRGLLRSPVGIKEVTAFWSEMLNERLSIACFRKDESNELVAINVFVVSSKDDPKDETVVSGHATGGSTLSLSNFLFLVHRRVLDRRPGGARAHERAN